MHDFDIIRKQTFTYDKLKPIENGSLVTFINNYLYATVDQLNNFVDYIETQFMLLDRRLTICNTNLTILEMKLNSVPDLDEQPLVGSTTDTVIKSDDVTSAKVVSASVDEPISVNVTPPPPQSTASPVQNQSTAEGESVSVEEPQAEPVSSPEPASDPELEKYKKMLRLGIPENAVRQKMMMDGLDPNRLK